jgi:hypothetical protein
MPTSARNDFKKAMSSIVLTAGAAIASAERTLDKAGSAKRETARREQSLVQEFCRLLLAPLNECGPGFASIPGFAEGYCRKHLIVAADFARQTLATRGATAPESKRLARLAALIEENLKANLDPETAKLCWFGDDGDTIVRELEKHSFG